MKGFHMKGFHMKKAKRILALIGVLVLGGLYVATLVCAFSANEHFMDMLMASLYASAVIPVLLWACSFISRLLKGSGRGQDENIDGN